MKFPLTKLAIVAGLMGTLSLSAAQPTLARTNRPAASAEIVPYSDTCEAYWAARGYYAHYYGSSACYAYDCPYGARQSFGAATGLERHPSLHRTTARDGR
jgi:hypothetical protein